MRIFFAGIWFGIGGPREVNKNLVNSLGKRVIALKSQNRILHVFEMFYQITIADVVIFSGVSKYDFIFAHFSNLLKKKSVYIMHGCNKLENERNHFHNPLCEKSQKALMDCSQHILCVSQTYKDLMMDYWPEYKSKFDVLTNGINWDYFSDALKNICRSERNKNKVILMGGGRITKRNYEVCLAIERINGSGLAKMEVDLYGVYRDNDDSSKIAGLKCVNFKSPVSHNQMLSILQKGSLYVQNSEFEPFSLGIVEALMCGCNVLMTKHVGAKDVMCTKEEDIINDYSNIEELQQKILNVMANGNNKRLIESIDKDVTSTNHAAQKLIDMVNSYYPLADK